MTTKTVLGMRLCTPTSSHFHILVSTSTFLIPSNRYQYFNTVGQKNGFHLYQNPELVIYATLEACKEFANLWKDSNSYWVAIGTMDYLK